MENTNPTWYTNDLRPCHNVLPSRYELCAFVGSGNEFRGRRLYPFGAILLAEPMEPEVAEHLAFVKIDPPPAWCVQRAWSYEGDIPTADTSTRSQEAHTGEGVEK